MTNEKIKSEQSKIDNNLATLENIANRINKMIIDNKIAYFVRYDHSEKLFKLYAKLTSKEYNGLSYSTRNKILYMASKNNNNVQDLIMFLHGILSHLEIDN